MNKNVGTSYLDGWKKTFVYKGNTTRKDFWSFVLVNLFIIFLVALGSFIWLMSVGTMAMVWIFLYLPLYIRFVSFFSYHYCHWDVGECMTSGNQGGGLVGLYFSMYSECLLFQP